ncbi:uncharacterized protein LOC142357709, partial [Convolutriloba macropyga]|uniref:uncharacterized protein LOC142357709 n=1 Tax=Convolutriloba macropyga TaxID=536237 RepID=UPI003F52635C
TVVQPVHELGIDSCGDDCSDSLREDTDEYNKWTHSVVRKIRSTGGKNEKRILILASPKKDGRGLELIDPDIYQNDNYMMAEWHIYASGPNKKYLSNGKKGQKYWSGDGSDGGKDNVDTAFLYARQESFTAETGLLTYLGAWMTQDEKEGALDQQETIYFV